MSSENVTVLRRQVTETELTLLRMILLFSFSPESTYVSTAAATVTIITISMIMLFYPISKALLAIMFIKQASTEWVLAAL